MISMQEPSPVAVQRSWFSGSPGRHRRTALVASAALAVVVTVGGSAAQAESGRTAAFLSSDATHVASSVEGALVDIVSTDAYQGSVSAGTGMVLSTTGEILTNNHVINGATSIKVTVVATQRTYTAEVVGTDPTADVAVLQLQNASGLQTLPIGDSGAVKVGQRVVASGNAGGDGGEPSVVTGTVTALDQDITASDDGVNAEQLTGLIQTTAAVVAGDSGGALATTAGKVIGMNTAASVSNSASSSASNASTGAGAAQSYAIPIATALSIADQIENGQASATVHIGARGFLGVVLAESGTDGGSGRFGGYGRYPDQDSFGTAGIVDGSGVLIGGVLDSGPAQDAGLQAGAVITAIDGTAVGSAAALDTVMATTRPGQKITLTWTDVSGQAQTATVVLGTAAAD